MMHSRLATSPTAFQAANVRVGVFHGCCTKKKPPRMSKLQAVAEGTRPQQQQQQQQQQKRLMLHVGSDTTIGVPFTPADARALDAALDELLKTFAEKQKAARPKRWDMMEVQFGGGGGSGDANGDGGSGGLDFFEVFCNPNAHATAFEAKLLLTLRAGAVSVTTEARLAAVRADLEAFLADGAAAAAAAPPS